MKKLIAVLIIGVVAIAASPSAAAVEMPRSLEDYLQGQQSTDGPAETVSRAMEEIKIAVMQAVRAPLSILSGLAAVIAVSAIAENLFPPSLKGASRLVLGAFSALGTTTVVLGNINGYLESVGEVISLSSDIMNGYIPVISGVLASSGKPGTAALVAAFSSAFAAFAFSAASSLLPSFSSSMICLAAAGSIGSGFLAKAAVALKKTVCWIVAVATAVAVGVFKLQISASSISDTLMLKTGRYVVSESIPLVGKSISGAITSLMASSAAAGSFAGIASICAVAVKVLPLVAMGLAISAALKLASFGCEALGCAAAGLLDALRAAVDVNTAFLASFFTVAVLALGTAINLGGGI